jgi:ABC-type sugar transport system ATPase subunit
VASAAIIEPGRSLSAIIAGKRIELALRLRRTPFLGSLIPAPRFGRISLRGVELFQYNRIEGLRQGKGGAGIVSFRCRTDIEQRVRDALALVGLEKNAEDHPWQLSGGMQQRVQIARALALRPDVMLMDEPFAALDAMTKASMQDELFRVRDRTGTSFVFITHDIEEAVYLGDRIAVLKGSPGRIDQVFEIGLPAPRDQLSTRQLPQFLEFRYAVHQAIGR